MELKEFFDYKERLMMDLCSNPEIVKLVTGEENPTVPNTNLKYKKIYPYQFIPETENNASTFVCFDVDIMERRQTNKTYYYPVIYIWILAHKSNMRTKKKGVLIDAIACEIDKMLNGNRNYGQGELELGPVSRFIPTIDYLGRELVYYTRDFNRSPGQKPTPAYRHGKQGV